MNGSIISFSGRSAERGLALIWGFAEATVFFVVPDVCLTWIALRSIRSALGACVFALAGALAGGAMIYLWAQYDQASVLALFDRLPAIGPDLIKRVARQLDELGAAGILIGGFSGVPYKLYAAQAAEAGMSLLLFLMATIPARGARFIALAILAGAIAHWLKPRIGTRRIQLIWFSAIVLNYALYWSLMPN